MSSSVAVTNAPHAAASATPNALDDILLSASPTLKVMRLQSPQLGSGGSLLSPTHGLSSNLLLPDSFGVIHVGETFSAYLGVLNPSPEFYVRGLAVSVQLQTPSRRLVLPSRLDGSGGSSRSPDGLGGGVGGKDIEPSGGVDAIVSRRLEEVGQHILRVEVGYVANGAKTLRKFYRFNVTVPLRVIDRVTRSGYADCLVSVSVENVMEREGTGGGGVIIGAADFVPPKGLVAERIQLNEEEKKDEGHELAESSYLSSPDKLPSAVQTYDACGKLEPGDSYRYLFSVRAESDAAALRGIACGDDLGQAVFTYRKAMGETGKVASSTVLCPPSNFFSGEGGSGAGGNAGKNPKFVVHRSGLSVDVATAASAQSSSLQRGSNDDSGDGSLHEILPVTVEPIDPPSKMTLSVPSKVNLLVVNHSDHSMNLQLQMRLPHMSGIVVCGQSFMNLGEIPPSGGSCNIEVRLVALVAGLFCVRGCFIVDLTSGREIQQPSLFNVFIELPKGDLNREEDEVTGKLGELSVDNAVDF